MRGEGFTSANGFEKWWKLNPKLDELEACFADIGAFTQWKSLELRLLGKTTIDEATQTAIPSEENGWRGLLRWFLDIIRFLARHRLPLREHRESLDSGTSTIRGNFVDMEEFLSAYDACLREHLTKLKLGKEETISYMSPEV